MVSILGIKKTRTTPYHPQNDGSVDRMNRTLKSVNDQQNNWDIWIPQALMAYLSTVESSTAFSPHCLMFGREKLIPIDMMVPKPPGEERPSSRSEYVDNMKQRFRKTYEITRRNTKKAGQRYKIITAQGQER